jgi:hypothetical protein
MSMQPTRACDVASSVVASSNTALSDETAVASIGDTHSAVPAPTAPSSLAIVRARTRVSAASFEGTRETAVLYGGAEDVGIRCVGACVHMTTLYAVQSAHQGELK